MKTATKIASSLMILSSLAMAQTLVTVNGTPITQDDVEKELMIATQGRFNTLPADKQAEFKKQILEHLVAKELMYSDAEKTGVLNSKDYKDRYAEVSKRIQKEVVIQAWQKREIDKIVVSDAEMKKYYDANQDEFNEKSADAYHILVKTLPEAQAIEKELKGLKDKALVAKFTTIAKAKSIDPSAASNSGKLPTFSPRDMVPEFSKEAFSMKVGTVSEPVKTLYGYHVIYLEKRTVNKKDFAEAKPIIANRLKMEKAKTAMIAKMQELEKKATIK